MDKEVQKEKELELLISSNVYDHNRQNTVLVAVEGATLQPDGKVKLLQHWRSYLLEDIHNKQKMLDKVDYSIYKLQKK